MFRYPLDHRYNKQQRFTNDAAALQSLQSSGQKRLNPELAKEVELYPELIDQAQTINSRYQLHLNILRYAMGFDRRAEVRSQPRPYCEPFRTLFSA